MNRVCVTEIPEIRSEEFIDWLIDNPKIKYKSHQFPCEEIMHQAVLNECSHGFPMTWQTELPPSWVIDISMYNINNNVKIRDLTNKLKTLEMNDLVRHFLYRYDIVLLDKWKTIYRSYANKCSATLTVGNCGELNAAFASLLVECASASLEFWENEHKHSKSLITKDDVLARIAATNHVIDKLEENGITALFDLIEV